MNTDRLLIFARNKQSTIEFQTFEMKLRQVDPPDVESWIQFLWPLILMMVLLCICVMCCAAASKLRCKQREEEADEEDHGLNNVAPANNNDRNIEAAELVARRTAIELQLQARLSPRAELEARQRLAMELHQ